MNKLRHRFTTYVTLVERIFLASLLLVTVASTSAQAQSPEIPKDEKRVVIGTFGGLLGQQLRAIIDSYTKPLGIETVYVESTSNGLLAKVRAQRNNPQLDLFVGNDQTFLIAKSLGLIAKLDPKLVTNLKYVRPQYRDSDGYGQFYEINPVGFVYRTDKFAEAGIPKPTSWSALSDPKLKGRVTLFSPTVSFGFHYLIGLSLAAGKGESDISPAWTELTKVIDNQASVVTTPGQADDMAIRGESWVYVCSAVRAKLAKEAGTPIGFSIPTDAPPIAFPNFIAPVMNAKSPVLAQLIINHMISKAAQTDDVNTGAVVPVNTQVELSPELKDRLGFDPQKPLPAIHVLNVAAINKQLDGWVDRFNRAVTR
jgi:putative spermidine/putrescine transport system substrate-binding protein